MAAQKICSLCNTEYPETERFCPRDGTPLRSIGADQEDLVDQIVAERYHVSRKLGDGGMGQVYLAEHVKMGRQIALKVMKPSLMKESDAISRFSREAANASRINHPNVAAVYDFGESADGTIYIAMEFVDGPALTKIIETGSTLAPPRVARIVAQVADALAAAHDLGIVHRDLKPDNIMIGRNRDGSDLVKVVDFGIAKAIGNDAQKVTKTGFVIGTPEFMSPEQLAGDHLDGRSDVYALGLVAFNMLTGRLPFPSSTAQESMIMRLTERPKSLAAMRPDVNWSPEIQRVMDRALERDMAQRFQTATEFADQFVAAIYSAFGRGDTQPHYAVGARQDSVAVPAPAPAPAVAVATSGNRGLLWGGVGVAGVAALVAAVWLTFSGGPKPANDAAAKQAGDATVMLDSNANHRLTRQSPAPVDSSSTKKDSPGATPPTTRGGNTSAAFPAINIGVLVADLPANLRQKVQQAAREVGNVSLIDDPAAQASSFAIRADSVGRGVVVQQQGKRSLSMHFDTASITRSLLVLFRHEVAVALLGSLETIEPPSGLRVDVGNGNVNFRENDDIPVTIRADHAGYVTLIDVDATGQVTILYPHEGLDRGPVTAGQQLTFKNRDFTAGTPFGTSIMRALLTDKPLKFPSTGGPIVVEANGPILARSIRNQVQAQMRAGARHWSSVSMEYTVSKR